jgi:hypothetical protein
MQFLAVLSIATFIISGALAIPTGLSPNATAALERIMRRMPEATRLELEKRQDNKAICQTSGGSPDFNDAITAVDYIHGLGQKDCCNTNGVGSHCTTMYKSGQAAGTCALLSPYS